MESVGKYQNSRNWVLIPDYERLSVCRLGFTGRCLEGYPFGSPLLDGAQAQFVRVPKAGGTLFNLDDSSSWSSTLPKGAKEKALAGISESSLLMLADILPTGLFATIQALNHPKIAPVITGKPWPLCFDQSDISGNEVGVTAEDTILTVAIIGLGPVGICATISMLDALVTRQLPFRIVAIDLLESRREKMDAIYAAIDEGGKGTGEFVVLPIEGAKEKIKEWTQGIGCNAVLEVRVSYLFTTVTCSWRFR